MRRSAFLIALVSLFSLAAALPPPVVEMFSPDRYARDVRQVVARFDRPIVPLGDPRVSSDAFTVDCAAPGHARWLSDREWVYDFEKNLPAGLACRFELKPGLRALGGARVGGRRVFEFNTGGPAVREVTPYPNDYYGSLAEDQRFVLRLDALPDAASVEKHVVLLAADAVEPIRVRLVTGQERDEILKRAIYGKPAATDIVIEPVLRLPSNSRIELVWGAGVATNGIATREEQRFAWKTRAPLSLTISCERVNADAGCIPIVPVRIAFSEPVATAVAEEARLVPLAGSFPGRPLALVRSDVSDRSGFSDAYRITGPFMPDASYQLQLPEELRDESGRALAPIDPQRLTLRIAGMPPLAKFSARFGILEVADPLLPVTIRRLEQSALPSGVSVSLGGSASAIAQPNATQIWAWLRAASDDGLDTDRDGRGEPSMTVSRSIFARLLGAAPPLAQPRPFAVPSNAQQGDAEVIGIPLSGLGLHAVEIESRVLGAALLGAERPYYAASVALVTNLSVHLKLGRAGSLVWVTTLDRGEPVAAARIVVSDCHGSELATAVTDASGIARLAGLPGADDAPTCEGYAYGPYQRGLLVTAQKGADVSFVHTSWDRGIEPWRFDVPVGWDAPHALVHTVFDRALFRAGEMVHMKHVLRLPALAGFILPGAGERPSELQIVHVGSEDSFTLPVSFHADGSADADWEIPKTAKLGTYQVVFALGKNSEIAGTFRVEEFRLPLLNGKIQGPRRPALAGQEIPIDVALSYLAGGPAAALPVELRTQVRPSVLGEIAGFEEHLFLRGDVKAGILRRAGWGEDENAAAGATIPPPARALSLDAAGGARIRLDAALASDVPQEVLAELSFRDPNGELQTIARAIPVWPSERMIGVRVAKHPTAEAPLRIDVALLDLEKRGVRGRVSVELFQRKVYSHRKRLVGGFYAYEHAIETTRLATLCEGNTDRAGKFACAAPLPATGQLIVRASARDATGRLAATHQELWIPGPDDYWYEASDADRMDLVPEQRHVEPGDVARIQVRMPFRAATALVTVEREGVSEAFVTRLGGRDPHVKLRITGAHAPNVFVSVLAVRGRVAAPSATAFVDLARLAAKLGMTELRVGLAAHTLEVGVKPERETYHVREKVRARIRVRSADGRIPPPGTELAIAVVDEALLELAPNNSWDLLEAMHGRRNQDVHTYTAQQQVVGKRHFGLKARPVGGGGGVSNTRELFDTLLLWRPRVALDADGEAAIEFALNDSLTSFRIAAIATGGVERFGTGFAKLRTTQDLMVLPGVAPVAREGDRVRPEFTLRNASEKPMAVSALLTLKGLAQPLAAQQFALAAGEARIAAWDVEIPAGISRLDWDFAAHTDTGATDRVKTRQRIVPAVPERVLQAELVQLGAPFARTLEMPRDAVVGRGGLDVSLRPTLASGTLGIDRFFREYPYSCLEQQSSTAIGTRNAPQWQAIMAGLPSYLDDDGLAKYWPSALLEGSDTLTAYLLAISHEAGWKIPADSLERMSNGLEAFVDGRIQRRTYVPVADIPLRRLAALEALSRYGRVKFEQLASIPGQPELWPTSALLDYWSLLGRVGPSPALAAKRASIERILRTRLTLGGTTLGFSTERADLMDWMLATAETNLNRFVLLSHTSPAFERDLPRLVKGTLARQRFGSWSTTIANAWGRLALERFSARFESAPVAGVTTLALAGAEKHVDWAQHDPKSKLRLPWPIGRAELRATHVGAGKPWAEIQSVAAIPLTKPLFAGYRVARRWEPLVQKAPGAWTRGDVVRVHLTIDAQSDFSWVVIDDPIPAGATILGSGLGRDSQLLTQGESSEGDGWGCPCRAFTERTQLGYRDYFQYLPKGKLEIEYTLRFNQDGVFAIPPTHVEAMYAPETFAELPHETLRVAK